MLECETLRLRPQNGRVTKGIFVRTDELNQISSDDRFELNQPNSQLAMAVSQSLDQLHDNHN